MRSIDLEFVNHAGFVARCGDVVLLTDPWLSGPAFDRGWDLLVPSAFGADRFAEVTHLWISHEHPDHFSPRCLRSIPEEHRKRIQVLFQRTIDGRVTEFLRKSGFENVREMEHGEWVELGDGVRLMCQGVGGFEDSWSCLEVDGRRVLNLNDCSLTEPADIRAVGERIGGPVDVLFTQFSISCWDGNADDPERRHAGARTMLQRACLQAEVLEARHVVPFASFIWFCHEENAYMNSAFLPIAEVVEALGRTCAEPVLLYPGDTWRVGEPHDPASALARYAEAQHDLPRRALFRDEPVPLEDLESLSEAYLAEIRTACDVSKLRLSMARRLPALERQRADRWGLGRRFGSVLQALMLRAPKARIWVTDHEVAYELRHDRGLRRKDLDRSACDIALSSAALAYAFKHLWGGQTLWINGRFEQVAPHGPGLILDLFHLAANVQSGQPVRWRRAVAAAD